jgi:hypothetical protein
MTNMMQPEEWLQCILSVIRKFSDEEYQQRVWVREDGPEVDSIGESYCQIFDDFALEGFLAHPSCDQVLSQDQVSDLNHLRKLLDEFEFDNEDLDSDLIKDPRWIEIRRLSKKFISGLPTQLR